MAYNEKLNRSVHQLMDICELIGSANTLLLYEYANFKYKYHGHLSFPSINFVVNVLKDRDLIEDVKRERCKKYTKYNAKEIIEKHGVSLELFNYKIKKMRKIRDEAVKKKKKIEII